MRFNTVTCVYTESCKNRAKKIQDFYSIFDFIFLLLIFLGNYARIFLRQ